MLTYLWQDPLETLPKNMETLLQKSAKLRGFADQLSEAEVPDKEWFGCTGSVDSKAWL